MSSFVAPAEKRIETKRVFTGAILIIESRLASIHPSAMLQGTQPALPPERLPLLFARLQSSSIPRILHPPSEFRDLVA
ncbi:MAG: hypothetical protein MAG451_01978 [Anaerolineales bacterium]|nr:hypothetical protein [Anaerolineales bacterium]